MLLASSSSSSAVPPPRRDEPHDRQRQRAHRGVPGYDGEPGERDHARGPDPSRAEPGGAHADQGVERRGAGPERRAPVGPAEEALE